MKRTLFAGLLVLEPGESLGEDNGSFIGRDREVVDRLLEVGAKTHRHNGLPGLGNPSPAPGASAVASGGTIAAGLAISVGFTLEDENAGETMLSPVTVVSTGPAISGPTAVPSAAFDDSAGELLVNTYFYAVTFTDGEGGETPLGPSVSVERPPGFAAGRVKLSALSFGAEAAGAAGWRLYRAIGGGTFNLLATGDVSEDTFIDDGTHSLDCSVHPPFGEENTTGGVNTLLVALPSAVASGAVFINLYASVTGSFEGGSLLGQYPVASAGTTVAFPSLQLGLTSPPPVNLSIGGAHQIDPDTELLDWHWKRPVKEATDLPDESEGTEEGDVRLVTDEARAYLFTEGEWKAWQGGGGASELLESSGMGFVFCGEDLTKARPAFACVTWMTEGKGEEEPENMAEHDILISLP